MEHTKAPAALAKYAKGQQMVLRPFHTTGMYHGPQGTNSRGRTFDDYVAEHPMNLDLNTFNGFDDKKMAVLEVVDTLSGGMAYGRQIILCKAIATPVSNEGRSRMPISADKHQYVVAVAGNAALDDDPFRADNHLCRKVARLHKLHKRTKTGLGTIHPDYYGTRILETNDNAEELPGGRRYVGIILMEHLEGRTIEELCTREPAPKEEVGDLIAPSIPTTILVADGTEHILDVTRTEVRNHIVKQIMHGTVIMSHMGIYCDVDAADVLVVSRRGGEILDQPQAVMLELMVGKGWFARWEDERLFDNSNDPYQRLTRPLHPFDRFTHNDFEDFDGWYDTNWRAENRVRLDAWMLKQFGLLNEPIHLRYSSWDEIAPRTKFSLWRLFRALNLIANQQARDFVIHSLPPIPQMNTHHTLVSRPRSRINLAISQTQPVIGNSQAMAPTRTVTIQPPDDATYLRSFVQTSFEEKAKQAVDQMLLDHPRLAGATSEYADSSSDESESDHEWHSEPSEISEMEEDD
ncbi:hypothetical protein GQ607_013904 [Colletotrichum asianum]|uniref:Uncharacterized protein n=1 Tax=Colletotrichum asianum TaxID=702518 RepID=A0A8H3W308_9PEZI|nr:hypothetical protein GQ607_013904 [Colletotrichum asianum]